MGNASSTLLLAALAGALSAGLATSCAKEFNDCRVSRTCKRSDGGAPNGGGTAGAGLDAGRGGLGAAAGFSGSAASGGTRGGASGRDGGGNGEDGGSDDVGGAGGNGHGGSGGDNGHGAAAEGGHKAAGGSHGAGGSHAGAGDSGNTAESGHGGEAGDGGDNGGGTHAGVGGLGGLGGGPTGPDTQPPHIVSISPEYGAIGVRADADIVVTFDEPMDEAETNQAYESDDLLPSRVSLSWSNDAQTLTIHPQDGLDYVPTTPETPRVYSFSISTFARDVAGNHLESAETGAFAMLLPVSEDVAPSGAQSIFRRVNTDLVSKVCDSQADVQVGLVGSSPQGLVVEFPIDDLLNQAVAEWESATLKVEGSGAIAALHVFRVDSERAKSKFTMPLLEDFGFVTHGGGGPTEPWAIDVLSGVEYDTTHTTINPGETQYLLRLDGAAEDVAVLSCASLKLSLSYLVASPVVVPP